MDSVVYAKFSEFKPHKVQHCVIHNLLSWVISVRFMYVKCKGPATRIKFIVRVVFLDNKIKRNKVSINNIILDQ